MPETDVSAGKEDSGKGWPRLVLGRKAIILLAVTYLILISTLAYVILQNSRFASEAGASDYSLISADIAWMDAETFLQKQRTMTVSYVDLKQGLVDYEGNHSLAGRYSVFFQDLTTGAWVGLDERKTFMPASLLKMPTVIAILKKVGQGSISLDTVVTLTPDMIDTDFGTLGYKGAGYEITVHDLLKYVITESDNTALWALNSLLTSDDYVAARAAIGMPYVSQEEDLAVSPKSYSNILRALYMSTYLERPLSQLALSMMAETEYNNQLPAGVPPGIKVAHKVGYFSDGGYVHDCGIVYVPEKPYILCVMSVNTTMEEADDAISHISAMTYEFVTAGHATS